MAVKTLYLNVTSVSKIICEYPVLTENEKINELTKYNNWLFKLKPSFKTKEETFVDLVSNLNEEEFKNLDEVFKTDIIKEPESIIDIISEDEIREEEINEVVKQEISQQERNEARKKELVVNITNLINKNIDNIVNNGGDHSKLINSISNSGIKKIVTSQIYTKTGIKEESNDIKEFEKQIKINVKKDNRLYKKILLTMNYNGFPIKVLIGGRIDGRIDKTTILETKRRLNSLFDEIPFYEKIQMELYCYLINDVNKCIHLQNYNNNLKKITIYKQCDSLLNLIKEKLEANIKNLLDS